MGFYILANVSKKNLPIMQTHKATLITPLFLALKTDLVTIKGKFISFQLVPAALYSEFSSSLQPKIYADLNTTLQLELT